MSTLRKLKNVGLLLLTELIGLVVLGALLGKDHPGLFMLIAMGMTAVIDAMIRWVTRAENQQFH